jgi:hypothetical protein
MIFRNFLRLAIPVAVTAALLAPALRAQSQDSQQTDSVAEAARRAREQKKAAASRPTPVITDDTLKPSAPAQPAGAASPSSGAGSPNAAQGSPAAQPASDSANDSPAAPTPDAASAPGADDGKKANSAELARLKQELADAQKGLDLLQRDEALQEDNLYSKPDYAMDKAGKAKIAAMKQDIADKAQAVGELKARVADLEGQAGTAAPAANAPAGGTAPTATAPPAPGNPQ